ncbi:MAG: CHASE3 domain-containing protein [Phenylobacterium sp.]|uniref:methyl-accepting chemotaxis protein n=1 Tax=Phenylobacterium sp. TaxID=1871053 RepID=UPI0017F65F30|nr:methyl-accepting chemotaxis protein [Phenylobacterium sp.]MBA4794841.1 CHASE3 domain-containing protein [Phenylobacterium sp.]
MRFFEGLAVSKKLLVAFSVVLAISLGASVISFQRSQAVEEATRWNTHTYKVLAEAEAVGSAMVDQETGVRGYLVSGDESFLEPYHAGLKRYAAAVETLETLTADNPQQQERIAALKGFAEEWRVGVAEVEIQQMKDPSTIEAARALEASAAGKKAMDGIRALLDEIRSTETALLDERSARRDQDAANARLSLLIGGVLAALASAVMWLLLSRTIGAPVSRLTEVMRRLAQGDNTVAVPAADRSDEIGQMAAAVQTFKDAAIEKLRLEGLTAEQAKAAEEERRRAEVAKAALAQQQALVVESLASGLGKLAAGDLTFRLTEAFAPDYEQLRSDFNAAMESLQETMTVIGGATQGIHSGSGEITQASDDLSKRTEQQAASLEETAAALDQITVTVRKTAEGANAARDVVSAAKRDAEHSGSVVRDAIAAMAEIEKSSSEIGNIIGVIDEIAFQTNLLALNAGVEAARAGDAGKGFAVVASEVRALAQRSAEAAKQIKTLISNSSNQVSQGVSLVGQTGEALNRIVAQVAEINGVVSAIASSAQEQATGLHQVNTAVNQMDQVTQQNAAMVEESTAASHSLAQEARELQRLMARFKTGQTSAQPPASSRRAQPALKTIARHAGGGGALRREEMDAESEGWAEF